MNPKKLKPFYSKLSSNLKIAFILTLTWLIIVLFSAGNLLRTKSINEAFSFLSSAFFSWCFIAVIVFLCSQLNKQAKRSQQATQNKQIEQQMYLARPREAVNQQINNLPEFTVSHWWGGAAPANRNGIEGVGIAIDDTNLLLALVEYHRPEDEVITRIFQAQDILEATVEEQGYIQSETVTHSTTTTKTHTSGSSMVGRAVVGGVLLGPLGAVVGGATAKKSGYGTTTGTQSTTNIDVVTDITLKILVNDTRQPIFLINFLQQHTAKNTSVYRSAIESASHWHGVINVIKHRAQ